MSVTPWTELEVEIFGTGGSFCNPKPYMSIREALMQEVHHREQAVRGEATARAVADGEIMERVMSMISNNKVDVENAAKDIALNVVQNVFKDAQDKSNRIIAETEQRCMAALDARIEAESSDRKASAKKGDQSSFLRSARILLFFSVCFAGMFYVQDSSHVKESPILSPSIPIKDIAMQHAVSAHDVRLVKMESDRQAFVQRLNRAEVELAAAQVAIKLQDTSIYDLDQQHSASVQAALDTAMEAHNTLLDRCGIDQTASAASAASAATLDRTEAEVKAVKDQLAKVQFVIPTVEAHVAKIESDFKKQLSLGSRLDEYDSQTAVLDKRLQKFEQDLSRGECIKKGFRAGKYQIQINPDAIICTNGYSLVGSKCLMMPVLRKSFKDARGHCRMTGGDMVIMQQDADWTSYNVLIEDGMRTWVGLQKPLEGGKWEWIDGTGGEKGNTEDNGYLQWGAKQPDGSGRCASAFPVSKQQDIDSSVDTTPLFILEATDCTQSQYYMCEYGGSVGFERVAASNNESVE